MHFTVNQIIFKGAINFKRYSAAPGTYEFKIFGNTCYVYVPQEPKLCFPLKKPTKFPNYNLNVTQNINKVLNLITTEETLRDIFEPIFPPHTFTLRISNIHQNLTIPRAFSEVSLFFIHRLSDRLNLQSITTPCEGAAQPTTLNSVLENPSYFTWIEFKLKEPCKATLKFQQSKDKTSTHLTVLLATYSPTNQELTHQLETWASQLSEKS